MKPIIIKNYGSIGHLPNSRLGTGDHSLNVKQASILTDKTRDYKDLIIVQEKLDGANVGIVRINGELICLTRKGHRCIDSPLKQFQIFVKFIEKNKTLFDFLEEGERIVGEWIFMAHGTKYKIQNDFPFVAFDLMKDHTRYLYIDFVKRVGTKIPTAHLLHIGQPISVKKIEKLIDVRSDYTYGYHGALEPVEGAVWRVEREGTVDFLGKYVRHFKQDGKYFHENHEELIYNMESSIIV